MRCLIGFFGLTRSLRHTISSIRDRIDAPLRASGIETLRAGHFNLPPRISNPRSGEAGMVPDPLESELLALDVCETEPQSDASIADVFLAARQYPDSFGDNYQSLRNLCHQLRSLSRVWDLVRRFDPAPDDIVLLLRPDLFYLDDLDLGRDLAMLTAGQADLVVPAWQAWGGLNDRFAFCTPRAARAYATRIGLFGDAARELGGMHAETFLAYTAVNHGLRVALTPMRAVRVRADGRIAANDAAMFGKPAMPPVRLQSSSLLQDCAVR